MNRINKRFPDKSANTDAQEIITTTNDINELRESEAKYRGFIENLPVMFYAAEARPPYAPFYISPAFERFGYPLEEWRESIDLWIRIMHPDDRDWVIKKTDEAMKSGDETDFEYRLIARDGKTHWVRDRGSFIRDEEGKIICWQGVILDITDSKQHEQELQRSEELYRTLVQHIPQTAVILFDRDFRYTLADGTLLEKHGYTSEMFEGKTLWDVFPPEICEEWAGYYRRALGGETVNFETQTDEGFFKINVVPIKNECGEIFAGMVKWCDITERKHVEKALKESELQYRNLFENANDLIYIHDLEGNFTSLNRAGEIITGYSREEALKMNIAQVVAPEFLEEALKRIADKLAGETPTMFEMEIVAKQGHRVSLELSTRVIYQNGKAIGFQGIGRDITDRKRAVEALKISEQRYRLLGESIMHQVWTAQPNGELEYVNERTLEYFGKTIDQILDMGWQDVIHPDDVPESMAKWAYSLETGENYELEFRLKRYDGKYRWHQARATAGFDSGGKITHWFGTNTDIDDKKIAEAKLNHFAGHDTLTGLPNRARFMHHLERAVSRSEHNPAFHFAMLFLDLDRFKVINDSLGHVTGDNLLIAFAKRLEECVRPNDIVARLGGDEFTVLLNNIHDVSDAVRVANRFLDKLSVPFKLDTYEVFTSASIGIIVSDEVKRQPEDYLRDADTAMYRAKAAGKSRYEIFDREMHLRNMNWLEMETDLRRALEQDEFRVYYQPIVNLETGRIKEFEALIRWQHPKHGLVAPNDFIEIAEETGLIIPIGKWILKEACRQTAEWQKLFPASKALSVAVNLSAKQLLHPNLVEQVSEALKYSDLSPLSLKLEVTESMVMENSEKALSVMTNLHALGIELSTDDFGTGYSSLSYLHRFPFNCLKIDRSFVSKMDSDEKSEAIVRTILLLGENLRIEAVAEGIETAQQLECLRKLGCKTGQGFLFSKPVDAATAARLLRDGLPDNFDQTHFSYGENGGSLIVEVDKIQ